MSLLHVRQIETYLRDKYEGDWRDDLADAHNLSRLLGRYAVDLAIGNETGTGIASVEITDAGQDRGIDAVAVDNAGALVVVVQSKWKQDGHGSGDLAGVLKFLDGVRALMDLGSQEPWIGSEPMKRAVRAAMQAPGGRLLMIVATTGADALAPDVQKPIDDLLRVLNDVGDENRIADFHFYSQSTFYNALSRPPRVALDLDFLLLDWGKTTEPITAYYGRTNALIVASWFEAHGAHLFAENIRVVLPESDINDGILRTLRKDPDKFWYFNNGITVLARQVEHSLSGSATRDAGNFRAFDASVVNGAQTVSTLGRALSSGDQASLEQAYVMVRCIQVTSDQTDIARRITRYTNTQNVVSSQDFVFFDDEQHRLVRELRLVGYEYLLRSGELPAGPDPAKVIYVRQAAVALACASTNLGHAVTAKREVSLLFDREGGPYSALFNPSVNALLVHRAVEVTRIVDRILDQEARKEDGIRSGVAVHGNRVIAHALLNELGRQELLDPEYDFESALDGLPQKAVTLLDALAAAFPDNSYAGNVFKNQERSVQLLKAATSQGEDERQGKLFTP